MALLLDWRGAGRTDADLQPVIEALQQGGLAVLPTESGYLFAASAANPEAAGQLSRLVGGDLRLALHLTAAEHLDEIAEPLGADVKRMMSRLWPGPVAVVLKASSSGEPVRVRCPRHSAFDLLTTAAPFPLLLGEPARNPDAEETAIGVADSGGDAVAAIIDAGPIVAKTTTWLSIGADGWRVEQVGSVEVAEIAAAAARWIVFVCTGNTCRSPMAESLFKKRLAERLGCGIDELPAKGYRVFSAGVAAFPGDVPSAEAVDVLREMGADLAAHRSQPLTLETVAHADCVIGMTRAHLLAVLSRYPIIGGSLRLLCGAEGDLSDPIGGGIEVYQACARSILRHVDRLLAERVCQ